MHVSKYCALLQNGCKWALAQGLHHIFSIRSEHIHFLLFCITYEIGYAICRRGGEAQSTLEKMTQEAQEQVDMEGRIQGEEETSEDGQLSAVEELFFEKLTRVMVRYAKDMLSRQSARLADRKFS